MYKLILFMCAIICVNCIEKYNVSYTDVPAIILYIILSASVIIAICVLCACCMSTIVKGELPNDGDLSIQSN